ncbi:MAG TPA: hypothetical protein VJY84_01765 [Candidatus Saccharimonadales bacterium]|nr:hypothetical protein [Candidatus Saccharimonadales bacterium]
MAEPQEAPNLSADEHKKLRERLQHYLNGETVVNDEIDVKRAISRALDSGMLRPEIIDMFGGFEEVERRIGSAAARELLEGRGE